MLNAGYRWTARALLAVVCTATVASVLHAQETAIPTAQVRGVTRDNADESLKRVIAVEIDHLSLKEAIHIVAQTAGVSISYSVDVFPASRVVSLTSQAITVQGALRTLLAGTGLEPVVMGPERIALQPVKPVDVLSALQQGTAALSGLVTDSGTGAIITQAIVHVDGTQLTVRSNATGYYTISGLAAGEYRVTARHVGYLSKTRVVTLSDSGNRTLDFELNQPATTLNEVVTTALGDQRRYQVGNVINTINVDSIAPNAPVTSVTDLITGRAPGVEVIESSGLVGAGEDIRIRGQSSMMLQGNPIIIVDGIRTDNTPGGDTFGGNRIGAAPSRLNDIDFNQIATIDILQGPAATTEYGTDGANGVIIITTKRGASGRLQWNVSASQTATGVPTTFPDIIWNWGHSPNGGATPFTASNNPNSQNCIITGGNYYQQAIENGGCIIDSTTRFNPLNHSATTEYGSGPASMYNVSVGGGTNAARYYFAGDMQNQEGNTKLPNVFRASAQALGFSNSLLNPNSENQGTLRSNGTLRLSSDANLQVDVAYLSTYAEAPNGTFNGSPTLGTGPAVNDSALAYGYGGECGGVTYFENGPLCTLGALTSQGTERWTGGATLDWRPASWLTTSLTTGLDHEAQTAFSEFIAQAALLKSDFSDTSGGGYLYQGNSRTDNYTVTFRGNATATVFRVRLMTSVGGSYIDTRQAGVSAAAGNLSANDFNLNGNPNVGASTQASGQKSGGLYAEENLGIGDRCYAPLGLRFDVASGDGANIGSTQNPNLSLTCTILTGKTSLRLRGAFGVSDQQPPYGASFETYIIEASQAYGNSAPSTIEMFNGAGNANIKPERDREVEGGLDLGLWNNRVSLGLTMYRKSASDLLYTLPLGWTVAGNWTENVGNARNQGLEATMTALLVQARTMSIGVTVNGSVNHNKLLTLAPGTISTSGCSEGFDLCVPFFVAGYPLFGNFGVPIQYRDVNADGIVDPSELTQISATPGYAGSSIPITEISVAPTLGFWRNLVVVNAMLQYQGGYKVHNTDNPNQFPAASLLTTPLWEQAREVAFNHGYFYNVMTFLSGDNLAFNEVSVAMQLPRTWARAARVQQLALVGAVRNLALWTTYPYGDPRTTNYQAQYNGASNSYAVTTDIPETSYFTTVPLTRQWTIRLNMGF